MRHSGTFDALGSAAAAEQAAKEYAGTLAYGTNLEATDAAVGAFVDDDATASAQAVIARLNARIRTWSIAGYPDRPNVFLGGEINGSAIAPSSIHSVMLQPRGPGFNNIIGGDGTATVGTSTPNTVHPDAANVSVALVGGYDNVVGSIADKIISDHSYTEMGGAGHNAIFGGQGHVIRKNAKHAGIFGGDKNDIGGGYSFATGRENVVNGAQAFAAGYQNRVEAAALGAFVAGTQNTCIGVYSWSAGGVGSVAAGTASSALGAYARARSPFQQALAGGYNTTPGDAQTSVMAYRKQTTTASSSAMVAAYTGTGSGSQFVLEPGMSVAFTVMIVGRQVGGATVYAAEIKGAAERTQTGRGASSAPRS